MGISHSTARYLAPASFLYDFAAQQYGLLSSPSMKDVHDRNLSFWSPQPYFIGGFFFPQQLFQLAWLYKLWKNDPRNPREKRELDQMARFAPYYAVGNVFERADLGHFDVESLIVYLCVRAALNSHQCRNYP